MKHRTALDLINEYWDKRRAEVYKEVEEELKEKGEKIPSPVHIYKKEDKK